MKKMFAVKIKFQEGKIERAHSEEDVKIELNHCRKIPTKPASSLNNKVGPLQWKA
jgi:hypothetical protein